MVKGSGIALLICDLSDADWYFGVHLLTDLVWVCGEVVLRNGWDACRVHPEFHHEGPSCQSDQWLQERRVSEDLSTHDD